MPTTLPLTSLDEAFLNLSDTILMSIQFEVRVAGRLDAERLAGALRTALTAHPLGRARLAPARLTDTRRYWHLTGTPDHVALEITDEPADVVRARLQSLCADLAASPALAASLVHDSRGDLLMLNLHHVAFDGLSAVRLARSIALAYTGQPDPLGGPPVERARDLSVVAGASSVRDGVHRAGALARDLTERRGQLARLAHADGEPGDPAHAFATLVLDGSLTEALSAGKPPGSTLNDVLVAALALTVRHWNSAHDAPLGDRISVMMPVNLRPAEWSTEVVSNFASYLAVGLPTSIDDLVTAVRAVSERTRRFKEQGAAGWLVDVLERGNALPVVLKRNLQNLLPLVQDRFVETTTLSNLGRLELPGFGDAGEVTEVWFSPPLLGELIPLTVGVAGVGRQMFLAVRARRDLIGPSAVERFAGLLADTLRSLSPAPR